MVLTKPVGPVAVGRWLYRVQFVDECLVRWLGVSSDGSSSLRASARPLMQRCVDGRCLPRCSGSVEFMWLRANLVLNFGYNLGGVFLFIFLDISYSPPNVTI